MQRGREERKEEEERSVVVNYARTKNVVSNDGHSLLISKSGAPLFEVVRLFLSSLAGCGFTATGPPRIGAGLHFSPR